MSEPIRQLLRDAAEKPSAPAPFDQLWARGRRRRRRVRIGTAAVAVVALAVATEVVPLLGQTPDVGIEVADAPIEMCPVTDPGGGFTPPDQWPSTPASDGAVWYGTDELWTVILPEPVEQKSVWWSVDFRGGLLEVQPDIEVVYERLDDPDADPVVLEAPGTNAASDTSGRYMIAGMKPVEPGCWRATATYRDAELSYVYLVEDEVEDE